MADDGEFKVTDRRRRDEIDEPPTASAAPDPPAPSPRAAPAGSATQGPGPAPEGGPDLQGLFIMLASSALVNLGEAADPETGERVLDLEQAREAIDCQREPKFPHLR